MNPNLKIVTIYKSLLHNYPKKGNKDHDDYNIHSANRGAQGRDISLSGTTRYVYNGIRTSIS